MKKQKQNNKKSVKKRATRPPKKDSSLIKYCCGVKMQNKLERANKHPTERRKKELSKQEKRENVEL